MQSTQMDTEWTEYQCTFITSIQVQLTTNMDDESQPHATVVGDSGHINSVNAVDGNSLKNAAAVHVDERLSIWSVLEEL